MQHGLRWSFVFAILSVLETSTAWSTNGHEHIARMAQALLKGSRRDKIRSIMHSDVIDVADWEAKMITKYPETDALQWHRQEPEWTCGGRGGLGDETGHVRCDSHSADKGSLFCALAYLFEHFAHDLLLQEYPSPKEPIGTPKSLSALAKVPVAEQRPVEYLKWLVILIGDLHQPLHWLHEHNYGRDIKVRYKGEENTLLDFWENYLPAAANNNADTNQSAIDAQYFDRSHKWANRLPTELFREWAKEVAQMVCTEVYAPMTVNHADGTRIEPLFELSDEQFSKWFSLYNELVALSGERLAFILNDILEHKRHKDAHQDGRGLPSIKKTVGTKTNAKKAFTPSGSNKRSTEKRQNVYKGSSDANAAKGKVSNSNRKVVKKKSKATSLKIKRQKRSVLYAASCNAVIAAVLVPSLMALLSWHRSTGGITISKHLKM